MFPSWFQLKLANYSQFGSRSFYKKNINGHKYFEDVNIFSNWAMLLFPYKFDNIIKNTYGTNKFCILSIYVAIAYNFFNSNNKRGKQIIN